MTEETTDLELVHQTTNGRLPTSTFLLKRKRRDIGFSQIRHRLSHAEGIPPECASHLYYEIVEMERGKGYGAELFRRTLTAARDLGLFELIVTCLASNPASARIIERHGGRPLVDARYRPSRSDA